jgi:type I restriction enzyme, S subunit
MENYKIIRKNQFACSLMQVRRDGKIPVAILKDLEEAIISQAYPIFEVIDENILLPDYLMMWFAREEFDREACFHAVGGIRGSLEWEDFCEMKFPIPSIEKQREIVKEYNVIKDKILVNEKICKKLEETAQAIYKQWFVDFEFPCGYEAETPREIILNVETPPREIILDVETPRRGVSTGNGYKSAGGEMVWCEELQKDVPEGWEVKEVKDFCQEMKNGGTPDRGNDEYWDSKDIPWLKTGEIDNNIILETEEYISEKGFKNSSAKKLPKDTVLMAMYGATAGKVGYLKFETTTNQACCAMICKNKKESAFLYYYLLFNQKNIKSLANGGAQENLSKNIIEAEKVLVPSPEIIIKHPLSNFIEQRALYTKQIQSLQKLKSLLLARMARNF